MKTLKSLTLALIASSLLASFQANAQKDSPAMQIKNSCAASQSLFTEWLPEAVRKLNEFVSGAQTETDPYLKALFTWSAEFQRKEIAKHTVNIRRCDHPAKAPAERLNLLANLAMSAVQMMVEIWEIPGADLKLTLEKRDIVQIIYNKALLNSLQGRN